MSNTLVGFRWIGDGATVPQGYAGYQFFNTTTGTISEWTGTNVYPAVGSGDWQNIYVNNLDNGGLLPIQGGSVTGAITGPTGWAASDNYNFPTSLKVSGQTVATVAYVNQQVVSFNDLISAKISQAISASTSSINTNANVAKYGIGVTGNGYFAPTASTNQSLTVPPDFAPIPLPKYPDGALAAENECVWVGAPAGMYPGTGVDAGLFTADANNEGSDFYILQTFEQVSPRIFKHYWSSYETNSGVRNIRNGYLAGGMYWMIFGIKASS